MSLFGCDVSAYQPTIGTLSTPWNDPRIDFGIVKLSESLYETKSATAHCAAIRSAGKRLGAYQFFHPEVDAHGQFEAFDLAAAQAGYGNPDDMVPAVDVEYFSGHGVSPAWEPLLKELVDYIVEAYNWPLLYCNWETWHLLGEPQWFEKCHLWIPFYSAEGLPMQAPPLNPKHVPAKREDWAIWQFGAGKMFASIQCQKGGVDQNRANYLPLISGERAS
jgi:hypothetical protein